MHVKYSLAFIYLSSPPGWLRKATLTILNLPVSPDLSLLIHLACEFALSAMKFSGVDVNVMFYGLVFIENSPHLATAVYRVRMASLSDPGPCGD